MEPSAAATSSTSTAKPPGGAAPKAAAPPPRPASAHRSLLRGEPPRGHDALRRASKRSPMETRPQTHHLAPGADHQGHEQQLAAALRDLIRQVDLADYKDGQGRAARDSAAFR